MSETQQVSCSNMCWNIIDLFSSHLHSLYCEISEVFEPAASADVLESPLLINKKGGMSESFYLQ